MKKPILLGGIVSDYSAEDKYDADGNPYVYYLFRIQGKSFFCKAVKGFFLDNGHRIAVRAKDDCIPAEVIGIYNSTKTCSFGKTSGLKAHQPPIHYQLIKSALTEKKRIYSRVHSSNYNYAQQHLSYGLVFENGLQLQADAYTGKRVKEGDVLFIYKPEDTNGISEFLNTTTGASSKLIPFSALGFGAMVPVCLAVILGSWSLPAREKAFLVAFGGLLGLVGLIAGVFEWSRHVSRKKRFQDFMKEVEEAK